MSSMNVDPFMMAEMEEQERKQFQQTVGRLKKKIHSVEKIMYSQPFADSKDEFMTSWDNKLKSILVDDCGLNELTLRRNPNRPAYGRQDTAEDSPPQSKAEISAAALVASAEEEEKKKKKKKKVKINENDMAMRKPFAGTKIEYETIGVIHNYRGGNTMHQGKRILKRLGPQGQGDMTQTGVPPWIGPGYYPNNHADSILYGHPTKRHQTAFKSSARSPRGLDEIKHEISAKKEWSGLFSGPSSVYGDLSIPFSEKKSRIDHSKCVEYEEDTNVWSKMCFSTTMGAKQVTNHYKTAPTPIIGHKTQKRHVSPRKRRKGKGGFIDGDGSVDSFASGGSTCHISQNRIFDEHVINNIPLDEIGLEENGDDASLATSVFGNEDDFDMNSVSTSSLSTQKRFDTVALLSKSVNFSVYTGFAVDKVLKQMVAKRRMKRDVADYTLGALESYNDSVAEPLEFTDPCIGDASRCGSISHTPNMSPRANYGEHHQANEHHDYNFHSDYGKGSHFTEHDMSRSLASSQTAGSLSSVNNSKSRKSSPTDSTSRRGSIIKQNPGLLSLTPKSTRNSISHRIPGKIKQSDIDAIPSRRLTHRRTAIIPAPIPNDELSRGARTLNDMSLDSYQLGENSQISAESAPMELTNTYNNLLSEMSRGRSGVLVRSTSSFSPDPTRLRRQRTIEPLKSSLSRSMSRLNVEEKSKAMATLDGDVTLGGLLLPGEGVDEEGLASKYSPPATPRLFSINRSDLDGKKEENGEHHQDDTSYDEDEYIIYDPQINKKKKALLKK